ncbi:acyl-CoA dehydrogenase [Microbacterium fluvii]|uniref:Acyl-CoA dehydrogenase n=1 Tax=Microbacterium fluvii TaxID=415215 RepID=A0ABW2HCA6_9MICO|nr:acyl-CoA dehydrogenase [Microbacterium fluvii]MCU4670998.1 acyl-CoA dehydrogenase [Microbacterium fluvii]
MSGPPAFSSLDALSILAQAAETADGAPAFEALGAGPDSTWGVFAAEAPDLRLTADRDADGSWTLSGTKPWCSLAEQLSHALVTAWTGPGTRRLFAVALRSPGVTAHRGPWVSRGLSQIVSAAVDFQGVPAEPVGDDEWYLRRPGFAWGGIGVAAVWWGAAMPLRDALARAAEREEADQLALAGLGEADAALWAARAVLAEAADAADAGTEADAAKVLAERCRAVVAEAVEHVLIIADHALGPAPLTSDEHHARRVADLRIYLRQHHAQRDAARLGRLLVRP